jgi:hypothetical protein
MNDTNMSAIGQHSAVKPPYPPQQALSDTLIRTVSSSGNNSFGGAVKVAKMGQKEALIQAIIYALYGLRSICNQVSYAIESSYLYII